MRDHLVKALCAVLLTVVVAGCGGGGDGGVTGGSAVCVKSTPDRINVTRRWDSFDNSYFNVGSITLTNAGTETISGQVTFSGRSVPSGLTLRLPANVNPNFSLAPGGSVTYTLLLGPASNRYDPNHQCSPKTSRARSTSAPRAGPSKFGRTSISGTRRRTVRDLKADA